MNPTLPVCKQTPTAWPHIRINKMSNKINTEPLPTGGDCFFAHTSFMMNDPDADEYLLVQARATPRMGPLEGVPHAHSFLIYKPTKQVRDLSNGKDVLYDQAFYYWLGCISSDEYHHVYTRDELWNVLVKHGTYGPWELAIEF